MACNAALQRTILVAVLFTFCLVPRSFSQTRSSHAELFTQGWKFLLGDNPEAKDPDFNDASWRSLDLPHDWSIELPFDSTSPTGTGGGALRGGTGWYRKTFTLPSTASEKNIFIDFDGVYWNSEIWINGHLLGLRPNGYISFRYDLTPYLKFGQENVIAVKVDNSQQPNSRWYSGSGIYRNVWLVQVGKVFVDQWGTWITTPAITPQQASVRINTSLRAVPPPGLNVDTVKQVQVRTFIYDSAGQVVAKQTSTLPVILQNALDQEFTVTNPHLWSTDRPYLYKVVTQVVLGNRVQDQYITRFGIRSFLFDPKLGFSLNGKRMKIYGVCDHHDLGCLGTAINEAAIRRQLIMLKEMGINGIRTSHNPPAPELLDLADQLGFIIMDEAFDMWRKPKNLYDYHLYFDEWHKRDLEDQVLRDRNHPSVFIWSIGNEIPEQWAGKDGKDTSGRTIARDLASIVHALDKTRPITSALDHPYPGNEIYLSGALDLVGFNYHHEDYKTFPQQFPGQSMIGTETTSSLQSRGHYDMPSDSIRRWPPRWDKPLTTGNPDLTCSSYDNCAAPWGSTHEETLKEFLKYDFVSGIYIWTGFDYIGEPTPYPWPARSSYFGVIDLAGFPKDAYYLYQSIFTTKKVLHLFPHWNHKEGDSVDVWVYYNQADDVELLLNGQSLGRKKKEGDQLHIMWRLPFRPGTLVAISRRDGKTVMTDERRTAGPPAKILLSPDRKIISADGRDLCFIKVTITDAAGVPVPDATNDVHFQIRGNGRLVGVDNGSQTSLESFKASHRKAFSGLCLAVVQSREEKGSIEFKAVSEGLMPATCQVEVR